jgi:hypothetical protein
VKKIRDAKAFDTQGMGPTSSANFLTQVCECSSIF